MTLDIEKQMNLTLHIPDEINTRYNGALSQLMPGQGTLVGNEDKLRQMMDYVLSTALASRSATTSA